MPIGDWWQGLVETLNNPSVGGGTGRLPAQDAEYLKAVLKANDANEALADQLAASLGGAGGGQAIAEKLPLNQALSQTVAAGGSPWATALNTPAGAGGLAALLGNVGAAISRPGSWQQRLGSTAGQMGQNLAAAEAYNKIMDKVLSQSPTQTPPPAPPNANANFQGALLSNPPQSLFPKLRLEENPELKLR